VTIEVRAHTSADFATLGPAERAALADAIPLLGPPPTAFLDAARAPRRHRPVPTRPKTHAELDALSLVLGRAIAAKLLSDPTLVARTRTRLAAGSPRVGGG
jgi:hypothetical protein